MLDIHRKDVKWTFFFFFIDAVSNVKSIMSKSPKIFPHVLSLSRPTAAINVARTELLPTVGGHM
jgi:hypothetical protein